MEGYPFSIELAVRDYECDMQGIVNNAVYQNYLEHARHEYLKSIGIDFADYTQNGIHLVVVRAEIDYKQPLQSGDRFTVGVRMERESRLKFAFIQEIHKLPDAQRAIQARIIGTAIGSNGRPSLPESLQQFFS
jgi:acyl-CoA thioester hydrolase